MVRSQVVDLGSRSIGKTAERGFLGDEGETAAALALHEYSSE
jgi:hypothetical protein